MTLDGIIWIFPIFEILEFGWVLIPMQTAVCLLPKMRKYCWVPFVASRARRRKRGSPGCVRDPRASSRVETGVSGTS